MMANNSNIASTSNSNLAYGAIYPNLRTCRMVKRIVNEETLTNIRAWMTWVLSVRPEMTATSWAKKAGFTPTTVTRHVYPKEGENPSTPSTPILTALADAADVRLPNFKSQDFSGLDKRQASDNHVSDIDANTPFNNPSIGVRFQASGSGSNESGVRMIPVVGTARAGAFTAVNDFEYIDEDTEFVPFDDPRYKRATVFAIVVSGNSCNRVYPDKARVYVVPAAEKGIRDGNFVVVRVYDAVGKAETTIKQVTMNQGIVELWPRSDDPKCQTPIIIDKRNEMSQVGMEIVGVVVGSYQPADEGGMLVDL